VLWLNGQGISSYTSLPNRATWYRPNGTSGPGPTDPYHLLLYRGKGFTLKAPDLPPPKRDLRPWLARRVIEVVDRHDAWVGTAPELVREAPFGGSLAGQAASVSRQLTHGRVARALSQAGIDVDPRIPGQRARFTAHTSVATDV
jgi:hypothetical protein